MKNKVLIFIALLLFFACNNPTPRRPISYHSGFEMKNSIDFNRKINKLQEKAIKYYIAQDSLNKYITSSDGFWYKYNAKVSKNAKRPVFDDEVIFEYEILDLANNTLYTKEEIGKVVLRIDKENIESGLQNGLKLMKEGEEIVFIFPSYKAFGFSGDQQKIKSNQPLIYKVTLNKIN